MLDRSDPRHAAIDRFEETMTAFAEKLGIEFEMSENMRSDILTAAEHVGIDQVLADITQRLHTQFKLLCSGQPFQDPAFDHEMLPRERDSGQPTLQ